MYLGTIFLEVWKRRNATLSYEWDVDSFEETEPDRPQFYGTEKKPVSFWLIWFINQRALCNHALSVVVGVIIVGVFVIGIIVCAHLPCHRVRHRNFIFGIQMDICPPYMHIKYLVFLTCNF